MLARNLLQNCDDPRTNVRTMIKQLRGVADVIEADIGPETGKTFSVDRNGHRPESIQAPPRSVLRIGDAPAVAVKLKGKQ